MKMKKSMALIGVAALAMGSLAACGGSSGSSSAASSAASAASSATEAAVSEAEETSSEVETASSAADAVSEAAADEAEASAASEGPWKIALIKQHNSNSFQVLVTEAAEAKADEMGIDLTILSSEHDAATQISQIEQCVSEKYDAILFEPVDPDGLKDAAKAAADNGVVMINVISSITDWEENGISAIALGDNVTAGEVEMQQVADLLGGKGNIAILTGPSGDSGGLARLEGYENILVNYPDIQQVVEPTDCEWDTEKAQATVESWLSGYEFDAIVCEDDGMALGAGNAAGSDSGIIIAGVGGNPDSYEAISDGRMTGTVSQSGGEMVELGLEAAVTLLEGGTLDETTIYVPSDWITIDNLADFQ
ncbi:MAG: sugar ABC transporter substrate-binding protein [Eubacterium sp.]|nr:sugar ABC transporter substrate-binding protein [Eubacterium sp.]